MSEKNKISLYISSENIEAVKELAKKQERSLSSMFNHIVSQQVNGNLISLDALERTVAANRQLTGDKLLKAIKDGITG